MHDEPFLDRVQTNASCFDHEARVSVKVPWNYDVDMKHAWQAFVNTWISMCHVYRPRHESLMQSMRHFKTFV